MEGAEKAMGMTETVMGMTEKVMRRRDNCKLMGRLR